MKIVSATLCLACAVALPGSLLAQEKAATPQQLVDALHTTFGAHQLRAVHTKGIIFYGTFTPDPGAASLTKAFHLQKEGSDVTLRFSDFTGIPDIPDNAGAANPRGFAIKFTMKDGRNTDIVGHSFDGFPTENATQFRELLLAIHTAGTDPKPTHLDQFLESHPLAKRFLTTQKLPASYATIEYFGVNSFKFTNKKGQSHFIRYQFEPVEGVRLLDSAAYAQQDKNYLINEIQQRVADHPIQFKMYAQIAEAGDKIADPSIAFPATRKRVLLGVITINKQGDGSTTEDKATQFSPDPGTLPEGIEPADPMIPFRGKAYPISVKERQ